MSEPCCRHYASCHTALTAKKLPCRVCHLSTCDRCDACCRQVNRAARVLVSSGVPNALRLIEHALALSPQGELATVLALEIEPHLKMADLRVAEARERRGLSARNERRLRKKLARKGFRG